MPNKRKRRQNKKHKSGEKSIITLKPYNEDCIEGFQGCKYAILIYEEEEPSAKQEEEKTEQKA